MKADLPTNNILEVSGVTVDFPQHKRGLRRPLPFRALTSVDLQVKAGETVGLVGESGSGKSTLARVVLGLQRAVTGTVLIDGKSVPVDGGAFPLALRKVVQLVFQDPFASLNPALSIGDLVGEGLELHFGLTGSARTKRIHELLDAVKLPRDYGGRRPAQLSGGQRQRVVLARALAVEPKLLILDEPVSSLDATTQRQVVSLLRELQDDLGVSYLFVGHDLGLINEISNRVVVLYQGAVMETGGARDLWDSPRHPYTQALMAAVPIADPDVQAHKREQRRMIVDGRPFAPPSPVGCPFSLRCPLATAECAQVAPTLREVSPSVSVACHHVTNA
jgi:oligopeptide transport system ATP-binding protein